ncbi:JAB domain-containing protein [Sphingomonas sp. CV7422]|uniref:JAB domain-containing protein n=1 Tax=Sphingomonas sp. CV7422 TaxID=3018036 RepID=UPI0022FE7053|nr:JAB domain-containing protein [Sphingomonas sp. CV7422]
MPDDPVPILITDPHAVIRLLADLGDATLERATVLYLDPNWIYLGRLDFVGTSEQVAPPLRAIIAEALRLDAARLILAHNHPGGDPRPSAADLDYTRTLARVAEALDMMLADHLILAAGQVTSLFDVRLL